MRIGLSLGVLAVAMLAVAGPAAAESEEWSSQKFLDNAVSWGDVVLSVGPDYIKIDWDGLVLGEGTSQAVREAADGAFQEDGADGVVDEEEYDQFLLALRTLFENEFSKWANQHEYSGIVLIDNAEPNDVAVTIRQADGLQGPVDQGGSITAALSATVEFPNVDDYKDIHTVKLDLGKYYFKEGGEEKAAEFAKDLTLTIQGGSGWGIDSESIQRDCAAERYADGQIVFTGEDASCFTGESGVLLAFAITGEGKDKSFLPGFHAGLAFLVALGSVLMVRRRYG